MLPSAVLHCLQGESLLSSNLVRIPFFFLTFFTNHQSTSRCWGSTSPLFTSPLGPTSVTISIHPWHVPGLCTKALPIIVQDKGEDATPPKRGSSAKRRMDADCCTRQLSNGGEVLWGNGMMNNYNLVMTNIAMENHHS